MDFSQPIAKFALRVAAPAVAVVVVALLAGLFVLRDMASQVDRIETRSVEKSVQAALHGYLSRLEDTHGDYAVWDDAVVKLAGTPDPAFVASNLADSSRSGHLFDSAFLIDEDGRYVLGFRNGEPALRSVETEFGRPLETLIEAVRSHTGPFDVRTGYLKDHAGVVEAVAVGSILPSTKAVPVPVGRPRLLVISRPLDKDAIDRLSREYVLDGLALADDHGAAPRGVRLHDPDGNVLGTLVWKPSEQGVQALSRIGPTAFATLALVCVAMAFVLAIGYRNLVELRRREDQAVHAANHDQLTGLPNRGALSRALAEALRRNEKAGTPVAVIFLDLDGFKEVNDSFGHEAGDELLRRVSDGFAAICSGHGLLARVGGDEFAVMLAGERAVVDSGTVAERLLAFLDKPIRVDTRLVSVGTSAGIAVAEAGARTAEELLRRADTAMYLAKDFGRDRVARYDPSIDAARAGRKQLAEDLRRAIVEERLALVYQPIFDADTMRPVGVEALLRWLHPVSGLVPPDVFIPIAEENGLIEPIGEWVIRSACRDALHWPGVRLSVNVSPLQFRNPGFGTMLAGLLENVGFPPERLEIEMTETHLVANPERTQAIIASLRDMGVTIALDDFGTGYSSIGYLRRFTFDRLKLDRSIVRGIAGDPSARRLCEATVALARALDLEVTAEGVETEIESAVLRAAGCDYLQGYALARPMSSEAVGRFLVAALVRPVVIPFAS